MGCHTWFYKKSNLSVKDAQLKAINLLSYYNKSANFLLKENRYNDFTKEQLENWIKSNNRLLKWINNDWITTGCYRILSDGIYLKSKDTYYVDAEAHDLFRIGGYPNDKLFSLEETLLFIENNKENIGKIDDFCYQLLSEFWQENPDGMINFG